jgi:hypothetical protein
VGVGNTTQRQEVDSAKAEVISFGKRYIKGFDHLPTLNKLSVAMKKYRLPFTATREGWEKLYDLYRGSLAMKGTSDPVDVERFKKYWNEEFGAYVEFSRTKNGFSECAFCYAYKQAHLTNRLQDQTLASWNEAFNKHLQHCTACRVRLASDESKGMPEYNDGVVVGPGDAWALTIDGAGADALSHMPASGNRAAKNMPQGIKLKVLGALIAFTGLLLFIAFGSTGHGANMTVEVLHRTLLFVAGQRGGRLPRKLRLQLDNASDNKALVVLAYCAYLVEMKLVEQVNISFLSVGHTHIHIDQKFSVLQHAFLAITAVVLCFNTFVKVAMGAWKDDHSKKPKNISMLYYVFDWKAHLVPSMGNSIRRFACTEDQCIRVDEFGAPTGQEDDVVRRFTFFRDAADDTVMTYKRNMVDKRTLPRPCVVGDPYDDGVVQSVQRMSKTEDGTRVWHVPVLYESGEIKECLVPLKGIKVFNEKPPGLREVPDIMQPPTAWSETLNQHKRDAASLETNGWFSGDKAASKTWWETHLARCDKLYTDADPEFAAPTLQWPAAYIPGVRRNPHAQQSEDAGQDDDLGPADPIDCSGNSKARRANAVDAAGELLDAAKRDPLEPGSFVFAKFEWIAGSQAAENAEAAKFYMPWCLAKLGTFEQAESVDEKFALPLEAWYHATMYDRKWTEWRIKNKDTPPAGVLWKGTIERGAVTMADIQFTSSEKKKGKRKRKFSGMLNAATLKKLAQYPETKFERYSKATAAHTTQGRGGARGT